MTQKIDSLARGVYAAPLIPFNEDLSCNRQEFARHCFDLIRRGCDGVALFGTTGEGASFSTKERIEGLRHLIADGFDPKKIILANGSSSIPDTVELAKEAIHCGCAALLISPPSYYKNIEETGVIEYYREVIRRIANPQLRVLLYHFPKYTSVPITLGIIRALRKEFPEIVVGMKESEGDMPLVRSVIQAFPGFKVYEGNERTIAEAVSFGAAGSICGIANLYPEEIRAIYDKKVSRDLPIFSALEGLQFIPAAKALMDKWRGASWYRVRPPLIPLNTEQRAVFFSKLP